MESFPPNAGCKTHAQENLLIPHCISSHLPGHASSASHKAYLRSNTLQPFTIVKANLFSSLCHFKDLINIENRSSKAEMPYTET